MTDKRLTAGVASALLPGRDSTGHKNTFGTLVCAVGSERYRGAAMLTSLGALAGGAGFVTVVSTDKVLDALAVRCPELILVHHGDEEQAANAFGRATACVVGCGLGTDDAARARFATAMQKGQGTLVLDADGLNLLRESPDVLQRWDTPILTPHLGEFSRLTGMPVADIAADRADAAKQYAQAHGAVMVLKSDKTVVATPDGEVWHNTAGNAGLAKAGSGDVLAGVIGSLAAMGMPARDAALVGVWLHSRAADLMIQTVHPHSVTASAVAAHIGIAMAELGQKPETA